MICNIYAPNGFDQTKTDFFHEVFQDLERWDGPLILAGDFNTTLGMEERHCRGVTAAEVRTGDLIKTYSSDQDLKDCWEGKNGFTWHRGKSMS